MAHIPKQLRIMRRLLTIAACLMCWISAHAQTYKPLGKVKVPQGEQVQIIKPRTLNANQDYYMAAHKDGKNVMTADLSVPAECKIILDYDSRIDSDCNTARLQVGGVNYYVKIVFVFTGRVIYIQQDHLKHIAVSGLQSITYMKDGEVRYTEQFDIVGQELWRRTAEELGKAAYIIY